ncbi:MAG: ribonuclease H-like domain-containing protein [Armatimonadetes bacterium]|nr:ribonuclease H-like domain-containing protein [Armatimonadota bacterium]
MLDPELRQRLSRVNIERPAPRPPTDRPARRIAALEDVLPGRVHAHEHGELYVCERKPEALLPKDAGPVVVSVAEVEKLGRAPEDVLFLDIETCGFANCPLFLIGTLAARGDEVVIEQYFARDYSEEGALLAHLGDVASNYGMIVTYNGKTFDVPYMRDRMVFHRIRREFEQEHLDLLQPARRLWKGKLPDCRLQTLEENLCGRRRYGDTPGQLIPEIYHNFVRTGNAAPLEGIFVHNALDLITMAELLPKLV